MKIARNSLKHTHIRNSELLEKFIPTEAINLESIKNITLLVICFIWVLCIFMSYFFFCLFSFLSFITNFSFCWCHHFQLYFISLREKYKLNQGCRNWREEGAGANVPFLLFDKEIFPIVDLSSGNFINFKPSRVL